jgi:hypothetical protein
MRGFTSDGFRLRLSQTNRNVSTSTDQVIILVIIYGGSKMLQWGSPILKNTHFLHVPFFLLYEKRPKRFMQKPLHERSYGWKCVANDGKRYSELPKTIAFAHDHIYGDPLLWSLRGYPHDMKYVSWKSYQRCTIVHKNVYIKMYYMKKCTT